jgi:hypothetical protein
MIALNLARRGATYVILALSHYKRQLIESVGEEMGDEYDDLLMIEHLIGRLEKAESKSGT